jgi:hypothetical protein
MTTATTDILPAMSATERSSPRAWKSLALWGVAVVIMLAAADYQEQTGPTKEFDGAFRIGGREYSYELLRSGTTDADAPVEIPDPGNEVTGQVFFKRYPTDDPFSTLPMESVEGNLVAFLPAQPAAGKVEYYVVLDTPSAQVRLPAEGTLVLRFKDPVPLGILVPHIILMFLALLVGVRTALGALVYPVGLRGLAWSTLGLMTIGGMILGPTVQKYAFGAFWTGWPYGYDLTDNKTLIMWIVWVAVALVLGRTRSQRSTLPRGTIVAAAAVMMAVYLIPHSLRGSELDYNQLEEGVSQEGGPR